MKIIKKQYFHQHSSIWKVDLVVWGFFFNKNLTFSHFLLLNILQKTKL